ncbi:hypothetical protein GCM10020331_095040 [Ectobacillus funiculus]
MALLKKKEDKHNKNKKTLSNREREKNVYPFYKKREHDYSDIVALEGFSETEIETIFNLLQRVRKM